MAQIYSIRQTQTPGEWRVERDDDDARDVAEYIVSRLRPNARNRNPLGLALTKGIVNIGEAIDWDPQDAIPIFDLPPRADNPFLDSMIPSLPPTG